MSSDTHIQLLSQTDTFQGVSTGVLRLALQAAHVQQVERDQFLISEGELATAFYVLTEGHAKMLRLTPDGHEILVKYIRPGQEVGVIAVLSGFEYPYAVQALDECEALVWPGEVLAQLMERHSRLLFNTLRVMVKLSLDLERRYEELLTEHVEQRVAQALLRLVEQMGCQEGEGILIDMPFPREDLAEFTGTTMYTVSRILSNWERKGFVDTGRKRVFVCRLQDIRRLASYPATSE